MFVSLKKEIWFILCINRSYTSKDMPHILWHFILNILTYLFTPRVSSWHGTKDSSLFSFDKNCQLVWLSRNLKTRFQVLSTSSTCSSMPKSYHLGSLAFCFLWGSAVGIIGQQHKWERQRLGYSFPFLLLQRDDVSSSILYGHSSCPVVPLPRPQSFGVPEAQFPPPQTLWWRDRSPPGIALPSVLPILWCFT